MALRHTGECAENRERVQCSADGKRVLVSAGVRVCLITGIGVRGKQNWEKLFRVEPVGHEVRTMSKTHKRQGSFAP